MIFHLGTDLPEKKPDVLNHEVPDLTDKEVRIVKEQIRRNSKMIQDYLEKLDLLVNKEKYPHRAAFINKIRERLEILIDENDTFRKVLWTHYQAEEARENKFYFS